MPNNSKLDQLAKSIIDEYLALGSSRPYVKNWKLIEKKSGKATGEYLVVAIFSTDQDILDGTYGSTKATPLPARAGSQIAQTETCPCCKGSGIIRR